MSQENNTQPEGFTKQEKESTYKPYTGPVVNSQTYNLFTSNVDRANAKRREEAHRKGLKTYKAKVWIPEHENVKGHFVWVEKLV
jgi:hypothetical protein